MPRVSIVTPVLNSATAIERAIRSVREQDYPEVEHIVIDGGSTDGTLEIIRRHESQLACWVSEPDAGIADAFNKGIARATGELIGIINADDWYEPGAIRAVVEAWTQRDRQEVILHGDLMLHNDTAAKRLRPRRWPGAIYFDMPVLHPTCFVPRQIYERVGLFDPSYRLAMDFDFVLRAIRASVGLVYVPQVLSHMTAGGRSMRDPRQAHREVLRSQRTHGLNPLPCWVSFAAKMTVNRLKAWALGPRFERAAQR